MVEKHQHYLFLNNRFIFDRCLHWAELKQNNGCTKSSCRMNCKVEEKLTAGKLCQTFASHQGIPEFRIPVLVVGKAQLSDLQPWGELTEQCCKATL